MAIPRGVEMMVKSLVGMLGLDPAQMMLAVEDIRKSLHSAAADMATIRRQNSVLIEHFGLAEPINPENDDHARRTEEPARLNGSGQH